MTVDLAVTAAQVEACYPAMRELRPHLDADTFVRVVREPQRDGYLLAALLVQGRATAVAGFRIKRTLFCDKFLYVDHLATLSTEQSKGYGKVLLQWLRERGVAAAELPIPEEARRVNAAGDRCRCLPFKVV